MDNFKKTNLTLNKLNLIFAIIFGILVLIFNIFPELDIKITSFFYSTERDFVYKSNFIALIIYEIIPTISTLYIIALGFFACYEFLKKRGKIDKALLYFSILIIVITGSGIIVNSILKQYIGRARPDQVIEFGGDKRFTKVMENSDQCDKNCSFSCGHAAAAFNFITLPFLLPRKLKIPAYTVFLSFGIFSGIARVIQGRHFASDVFASGFIVLGMSYLIYKYLYLYITSFLKKHPNLK